MKKVLKHGYTLVVIVLILSGCAGSNQLTQSPVAGTVTYQAFYDDLAPYGTWIDYPGYGNVWNPRNDAGFRPYATNGHWVYSNEGWAWESGYNWGWAPFHYGRWLYDDMYGWLWMPGYDWSPAWVTWGSVDNYYAWAPLMPEVNVSAQYGGWRPHSYYWNVCDRNRIYDRDISNVIIRNEQNKNITNNITIINNYNTNHNNNYYSKGPDVMEVEKYTNRKIDRVSFKDVPKIKKAKEQGNQVNVYRPAVQNPQQADDVQKPGSTPMPPVSNGIQVSPGREKEKTNNDSRPITRPVEAQRPMVSPVNPAGSNSQVHPVNEKNKINQQQYTIPQPREVRRAATNQIRPVRTIDQEQPSMQRSQQRRNIEQLPVQKPITRPNTGGGNAPNKIKE